MTCPHCGESAEFQGYRPKTATGILGDMVLERGYYHCEHCHKGGFPWDELLRLSTQRLTPGAQELTALAGIVDSFGEASLRTLNKMSGIRLSESTVQRTTEAAGQELGERLKKGEVLGPRKDWEWHKDAQGRTCGSVSVDATGIAMQGEKPGSKADGRMVYVGMIFNPLPRDAKDRDTVAMPCDNVRYLAGFSTLDELGLQLRRQGAHVGLDPVEQWLALVDGGSGLEHFMEVNFPRAKVVLDFRHATEHLEDFVDKYRPGKPGEKLLDAWCHTLKHAGGSRVLELVERLDSRR